ncbi:MAG: hypothetical protein Q8P91_03500 [bacterium]|nr:hypothetical protein [bacterium]
MSKYFKIIFFVSSLLFVVYVARPSPGFPDPLPDALKSTEPADLETPLRRGYFTNATRDEVMEHYFNQFRGYRLNYPPEESGTIIRDQTHSTFLEEIVHPLRESIFISGYEPEDTGNILTVGGLPWRQKVIVKYVPSSLIVRIIVSLLIVISWPVIVKEWMSALKRK